MNLVKMYLSPKKMEWGMVHLCHYELIQLVLALAIIDQMEMDHYGSYQRHNHEKHYYCMRQGVGHASINSSNDQIARAKV